ncbi:Mov34/MPN/PAD-1 family protein [Paenibacillus glycinis]|uniref:JAB domain-containing protein n=1 Tax=Paenibacillus glycinis TaxID=2697035 RepID=A0ABW9XTI5_9BACL|nr:Mov34/MPN/PAD-1 family protein [Paenibacillus glycinis]NBD25981.1 hypothetical protein [Paenibacillus glycinis]
MHLNTMPRQAVLDPSAYRTLVSLCMDAMPLEACGVLTGHYAVDDSMAQPDRVLHITDVHRVSNAASRPEHRFSFDPQDWVQVLYRMQKNRQSLVGFFHSHPSSPPVPSAADLDGILAAGDGTSYWILAPDVRRRGWLIQSYWMQEHRFHPLMLAQVRV